MLRLILILEKVSLWCYQVLYLTIEIVFVMFRSISLKNQIENQKCQPVFRILCRKIPLDQKKVTWPEGTENSHMTPGTRDFPSAHKIPAYIIQKIEFQLCLITYKITSQPTLRVDPLGWPPGPGLAKNSKILSNLLPVFQTTPDRVPSCQGLITYKITSLPIAGVDPLRWPLGPGSTPNSKI